MKNTHRSVMLLALFGIFSAGCTTSMPTLEGQLDPTFGTSVHDNVDAQFVPPTDKQKRDTFIPADPARAAIARKNYKENTVPPPTRQ